MTYKILTSVSGENFFICHVYFRNKQLKTKLVFEEMNEFIIYGLDETILIVGFTDRCLL